MAAGSSVIAKRYSKALWRLADGPGEATEWVQPLKSFSQAIETSADLRTLLKSPAYPVDKKWSVFEEILTKVQAPKQLQHFAKYLLKSGRLEVVSEITKQFETLVDISNNTVEATVESALPLSEVQNKALVDRLEKFTGKKIRAKIVTKPELLAGIRVHMMGRTLDATLAANLGLMQQALLHAEA